MLLYTLLKIFYNFGSYLTVSLDMMVFSHVPFSFIPLIHQLLKKLYCLRIAISLYHVYPNY